MTVKNGLWKKTGVKVCPVCSTEKSVEEFKLNTSGVPGWCKPCTTEKMRGYQAARRSENKERLADWNRKTRYNLTPEEYTYMVIEQGGKCAICKDVSDGLCVDHDHNTGEVRGLLCRKCNTGIGMLQDNLENLKNAVAYLAQTQESRN
jgi:hypothetical protein